MWGDWHVYEGGVPDRFVNTLGKLVYGDRDDYSVDTQEIHHPKHEWCARLFGCGDESGGTVFYEKGPTQAEAYAAAVRRLTEEARPALSAAIAAMAKVDAFLAR